MKKIKVVQICSIGNDWPTEYLDDKGRVWSQRYVKQTDATPAHYTWHQLDLPDEPEENQDNA